MARNNTMAVPAAPQQPKTTRTNPFKAMIHGTKADPQTTAAASPSKTLGQRYLTRSQTDTKLNTAFGESKPHQPLGEINNLQQRPDRKPQPTQAESRPKSLHKRTKSALSLKSLKGRIWDENNDTAEENEEPEHPLKSLKHSKKSKSSTSLSAFLARPKSKGKDAAENKSKGHEQQYISQLTYEPATAPIWAQFASKSPTTAPTVLAADEHVQSDTEAAFEAVLESRNVPSDVRQKMRTLEPRLKAEFVRQHQTGSPGKGQSTNSQPQASAKRLRSERGSSNGGPEHSMEERGSPKKSRPRSFQLPLSKSSQSPTKKSKSGILSGHGRTKSADISRSSSSTSLRSQASNQSSSGSIGGLRHTTPQEFITYLRKTQAPQGVEVGKLQRLRQLLRNETVDWVDTFICNGGMEDVVSLLYGIIDIEWRDEHDDSLLHHTLNCLKALATTDRGLEHLSVMQEKLFPTLLKLLFSSGEERKAPAEFTTRELIIALIFAFLRAGPNFTPAQRAEKVLSYLRDPEPEESERLPGFILTMRRPRPYKVWYAEFSSVIKEVFWIFLHPHNVIAYPDVSAADDSGAAHLAAHFPTPRAPVAAAPYVGGVEWEATNYVATHLDLLNGLLASLPTRQARNELRTQLRDSGFEKIMGCSLRTCKQKFYGGVHEALATYVGAGRADEWEVRLVREGPTREEKEKARSPGKAGQQQNKPPPPQLGEIKVEAGPRLNLHVRNPDLGLDDW